MIYHLLFTYLFVTSLLTHCLLIYLHYFSSHSSIFSGGGSGVGVDESSQRTSDLFLLNMLIQLSLSYVVCCLSTSFALGD